MDIVKRKLSELKLDSDNARLHNARNMSAIKESLLAFSQYAPIVVQESTGVIIAGNGTYQAAKDLGWDEIECVAVDVDDDTLKMMSIVDNRTGELSNWDNTSLLKVLTTLDELKLKKAGFKTDEVEKMMESMDTEGEVDKVFDKIKKPKNYHCPRCGKNFTVVGNG